ALLLAAAPPPAPPPDFDPGWLPATLAAGPGLLVHGLGHLVAGDTEAAVELLLIEGVSLGMIFGGTVLLAGTGASRRIAGPNILFLGAGVGLFTTSWLADIAGSSGLLQGKSFFPRTAVAIQLGHRYIYDPQFAYRHFAVLGVDSQMGALGLDAEAWIALDDANWRVRQATRWRLLGAAQGGSHLDGRFGLGWHEHGTEGFAFLTVEGELGGRYDLGDAMATLSGTFVEGGVGWAIEMYDYDVPGLEFAEDVFDQMLFRFGYGMYLGRGEVVLHYDHRRDSFAQGLGLDGIGVGAIGSVGVRGGWMFTDDWGIAADYAVGSAHVLGISARWRAAP
ncbi:MAG: hypothetical protein ACI9U2_001443, partial [Bradymonadia bacterium]